MSDPEEGRITSESKVRPRGFNPSERCSVDNVTRSPSIVSSVVKLSEMRGEPIQLSFLPFTLISIDSAREQLDRLEYLQV